LPLLKFQPSYNNISHRISKNWLIPAVQAWWIQKPKFYSTIFN